MIYVSWPLSVNDRFANEKETLDDNAITTEYASGRKAVMLKNTKWPRKVTCSLWLDTRKNEPQYFWAWYKDVLGGLSGAFVTKALNQKDDTSDHYYRFTETPSDGGGAPLREFTLSLEEV